MNATAADWSPVDAATFNKVFGLSAPAFLASMIAYLTAQFIDVRIFHFWKKLTKGKHLWLRNNASTMFSQLVDTSMVLFIHQWYYLFCVLLELLDGKDLEAYS